MSAPLRSGGFRCEGCGYVQAAGREECRRCGARPGQASPGRLAALARLALPARERPLGPLLLGLALGALGWAFVFRSPTAIDQESASFFHHLVSMANLVFHEAGHWILAPFGRFAAVAGGSLLEVAVPAVCLIAFLQREDRNGSAFALWWSGVAITSVATYAADARAGRLILLGGRTGRESPDSHDWHNLLEWAGLLWADRTIGWGLHILGATLVITAIAWCGWRALHAWQLSPSGEPRHA